jgi:hypothetical protein
MIKITISIKSIVLIFILSGMLHSISAGVQFDTRAIMSIVDEYRDSAKVLRTLWGFQNVINAERKVNRSLSLQFRNHVDGGLRSLRLAERTVPFVNNVYLGLYYEFVSSFHLGVSNDLIGAATTINPEYVDHGSSLKQRSLTAGTIGTQLVSRSRKVKFATDFNYFRLNYDLEWNQDTNITVKDLSKAIDDDLWSDISFKVSPTKKFYFSFGSHLKNDFNKEDAFNYGDHYVEIGGDGVLKVFKRKVFVPWYLAEHYRVSEQLYYRNEAEGPATLFYIRPLIKGRKRRYIKVAAKLDLSARMQKQMYEFTFRKASRKNSFFELGYWTVVGSYFPRRAIKANSALTLGIFQVKPGVQFYYRRDIGESSYRYYRTDLALELLLQISKRSEFVSGFFYSNYNNLKLYKTVYPARGSIYLGFRKW